MKKLLFIIIFSLLSFSVHATCIVIVKTKNSILVAADSRSNYANPFDPKGKTIAVSICKIHNFNGIYFAVAGHGDQALTQECFNAIKKTNDIGQAINVFGQSMTKFYSILMAKEKELNPSDYNYYLKNILAMVSFFEVENNVPVLYCISFSIAKDRSINYNITQPQATVMGIHDHIDALSYNELRDMVFNKRGIIYGLEDQVKLEIRNHPEDIAFPIDLLELKQGKANWIRRKKECN